MSSTVFLLMPRRSPTSRYDCPAATNSNARFFWRSVLTRWPGWRPKRTRRAQIELQPCLGDQENAPRLEFPQRVKQIDRRAALAGQLADQHHIDIACLGQRHDLIALGAIIFGARSRFLPPPPRN